MVARLWEAMSSELISYGVPSNTSNELSSRDQSVARKHPSQIFSGEPEGFVRYSDLVPFCSKTENATLVPVALLTGKRCASGIFASRISFPSANSRTQMFILPACKDANAT